jgi:hypothetical protein
LPSCLLAFLPSYLLSFSPPHLALCSCFPPLPRSPLLMCWTL